jgi:hypothetical protein
VTAVHPDPDTARTTADATLGGRLFYSATPPESSTDLALDTTGKRPGDPRAQVTFRTHGGQGPLPKIDASLVLTRTSTGSVLRVEIPYPGPQFAGTLVAFRGGSTVTIPASPPPAPRQRPPMLVLEKFDMGPVSLSSLGLTATFPESLTA